LEDRDTRRMRVLLEDKNAVIHGARGSIGELGGRVMRKEVVAGPSC
jgi:hypothetical protein